MHFLTLAPSQTLLCFLVLALSCCEARYAIHPILSNSISLKGNCNLSGNQFNTNSCSERTALLYRFDNSHDINYVEILWRNRSKAASFGAKLAIYDSPFKLLSYGTMSPVDNFNSLLELESHKSICELYIEIDHFSAESPLSSENLRFFESLDNFANSYSLTANAKAPKKLIQKSQKQQQLVEDQTSQINEKSHVVVRPFVAPQDTTMTQRDALIDFYYAFNGPNWVDSTGWLTEDSLNDWYGVDTDGDGNVVVLNLWGNHLWGTIPESIQYLSHLVLIHVPFNSITGNAVIAQQLHAVVVFCFLYLAEFLLMFRLDAN